MGVFKQFATNRKLEEEGVPVEFSVNPDGTLPTIFVRRVQQASPKYQAVFERVTKPYKHLIEKKLIDADTDTRLMQRICVETAVAGWKNMRLPEGIAGGKGEGDAYDPNSTNMPLKDFQTDNAHEYDMPYSVDACCEVFRILPDLWRQVSLVSVDPDSYKVGELEEMAKN